MLSALILENFKAFGGRRTIPIRPLTLIFGPNSAGKSAILQSLLLLKQTMDSSASYAPLQPRGELVDLGTFEDMLHRHDRSRTMEVCPLFSIPHDDWPVFEPRTITGASNSPYGMGLRIQSNEAGGMDLANAAFYIEDHSQPAFRLTASSEALTPSHPFGTSKMVKNRRDSSRGQEIWEEQSIAPWRPISEAAIYLDDVEVDANAAGWRRFIDWCFGDDVEDEMGPDIVRDALPAAFQNSKLLLTSLEVTDAHDWPQPALEEMFFSDGDTDDDADFAPPLGTFAKEISAGLRDLLRGLLYIGPLRDFPERHYLFSGAEPIHVGTTGQLTVDLLFNRPDLVDQVNAVLGRFKISYRIAVQKLRDESGKVSDVFTLQVVDQRSGVAVSLRDVGFGISQVLPVLVQTLLAENNTVLIEQPELHLHPRLQAELADVFIESALGDRKNTFLIETHSEHLILRIMRRLRETSRGTLPEGMPELRPDDVSIIYVHPMEDGSGSIPLVMDLDEEGDLLTAWPNGFFEEGFHERFA